MIDRFNHVGISVADIDRSVAFYRDLFRMEVVVPPKPFSGELYETIMGLKGAAGKVALVRGPGIRLELFQFSHPSPRTSTPDRPVCDHGLTHFCVEVTDLASEYQRLKAAGVVFHCSPLNWRGEATATYGRDPDGNVFEMLELTKKAT